MASACGTRMMVVQRVKRNQKSRAPSSRVFHFRRYGSATREFGPRSLRTSAHTRKNAPPTNNALNTPERHQSSLSPCSQATSNIARPVLAYKNPAKLGAFPDFFGAFAFGIPL